MLIIIPARGGSKRIPYKNIYPLHGKPLLEYTLEAIIESGLDLPVYVSTEDKLIADLVKIKGFDIIDRPKHLSIDSASTESTLLHSIDFIERNYMIKHEWIMTLPPTSPFRSPANIRNFYTYAMDSDDDIDCYFSVTKSCGDFWHTTESGSFERIFRNQPRNQHEREPIYEENSCIYVTRIAALRSSNSILGHKARGVPISFVEGFDINNQEDIEIAKALFSMR